MLTLKNSMVLLMIAASANYMHFYAWNCNCIPSGNNAHAHDILNTGYQVAFHDLSCYL